jgi:hypothetical protein
MVKIIIIIAPDAGNSAILSAMQPSKTNPYVTVMAVESRVICTKTALVTSCFVIIVIKPDIPVRIANCQSPGSSRSLPVGLRFQLAVL